MYIIRNSFCSAVLIFNVHLNNLERAEILATAMLEAKLSAEEIAADDESSNVPSSSLILSKGFKMASSEALAHTKARLLFEDMVSKAEKMVEDLHSKYSNSSNDPEARAEELAEELFHLPGSRLTEEEVRQLWIESSCRSIQPMCMQPSLTTFRTIDGTCNNLVHPKLGAASTPFRRILPAWYEDGVSSPRGHIQAMTGLDAKKNLAQIMKANPFCPPIPSARIVSQTIVRDKEIVESPFTHMLMQWGQFLDHDMDFAPEVPAELGKCSGCKFREGVCEPILIPEGDVDFGVGASQNDKCLHFRRSATTCDNPEPGSFLVREQINDITSYIDGSMIYGSRTAVANAVRSFKDGLLVEGAPVTTSGKATLPLVTPRQRKDKLVVCVPDGADCYLAGDLRVNEQVALTAMHTIWLREHNRIARELKRLNSHWDDERTFQEARKIVGAQIQKITYFDYLPKILGSHGFRQVIKKYRGYNPNVNGSIPNAFATAAFRFGHSMIQPHFSRLDQNYVNDDPLPLREAFFNRSAFLSSDGTDRLLRGLVTQASLRVDEFLNPVLTAHLFQRGNGPGLDLASLNIQRQRDHGMAPYVVWRNFCRRTFPRLGKSDIDSQLTFIRFFQVHGSLDNVDLWIGGLSEERMKRSLLGETFACIFGLAFTNLRDGDRFYFENSGVFSPKQKLEIMKASLSRVICDNADAITSIQPDAFLSNQKRRTCSSIPSINLRHWEETACYVRVEQDGSVNRQKVVVRYQTDGSCEVSRGRFGKGVNERVLCLSVQCPSSNVKEMISVFLNRRSLQRRCIAHPSAQFPPNAKSSFRGVYRGTGFSNNLINSGSGLYSSLSLCQASGAAPGVTFSCAHQDLTAQDANEEDDPCEQESGSESDDHCDQLPEDILDEIKNEQQASMLEEKDDMDATLKSSLDAYVEEDVLIHELSEALDELD